MLLVNTQDILNIFLIIGLFVFISCMVFTTYFLILTLKAITKLADDLKETTEGIKGKLGLKMLAAIPSVILALVSRIIKKRRGGE